MHQLGRCTGVNNGNVGFQRLRREVENDIGFLFGGCVMDRKANILLGGHGLFSCKRDEAVLHQIMTLQLRCVAVHGVFQIQRSLTRAELWQAWDGGTCCVAEHEGGVIIRELKLLREGEGTPRGCRLFVADLSAHVAVA